MFTIDYFFFFMFVINNGTYSSYGQWNGRGQANATASRRLQQPSPPNISSASSSASNKNMIFMAARGK